MLTSELLLSPLPGIQDSCGIWGHSATMHESHQDGTVHLLKQSFVDIPFVKKKNAGSIAYRKAKLKSVFSTRSLALTMY